MSLLNQFIDKLTRLKRANTIYGKAPHKPVLLLSIIELFDKGLIENNCVYINTDLVGAFLENWRLLVDTTHSADFTQPFYYLQSEKPNGQPFWFLQPKPGCQVNAYIRSVNVLSNVLDYGYFAENIYLLLTDSAARSMMRVVLLNTYFPQRKAAFVQAKQTGEGYLNNLENYLLNEPNVPYQPAPAETEEDEFVRGGLFKKLVPKVYNNACCITGMRLQSSYGHTFIDACHIIPFAVSHNDKVTNGLALCPNLHRAFDRGLVTVSSDYRVIISPHLIEGDSHPYNIKQLKGVKIALPLDRWHYPNLESLEWHRDEVFKG